MAKEMSYEARELEKVLVFFSSHQVEEMSIKFREPVIITRDEYRELFSAADSIGGIDGMDQFVFDETFIEKVGEEEREVKVLAKLNIWYDVEKKDDKELVKIYEIYAWREKLS